MSEQTTPDQSESKPALRESIDSAADVGQSQVQENVDVETGQGFQGTEVDPTPNENYTVPGRLAGLPTPETDPEHAAKVAAELRNRA